MTELKPAKLDEAQEALAYRSKFPWKWIGVGAFALACLIGGYQIKKHRDADALRARILHVHGHDLQERSARVLGLEHRIEGFVMDAVHRTPVTTADARLQVDQLRRGQGLYLRVSASDLSGTASVADAARSMEADAVMNCMGLAPMSARTLFEKGQFLESSWTRGARDTSDVLRLRVIEEELLHHMRTDLPVLEQALRSEWFMLAIERGSARSNGPVDVYLWNLRDGASLLSVRTQPAGTLITARANFGDAPATGHASQANRGEVAADCSIASQVRAVTGNPVVSVTNAQTPPVAAPRAEVAAPAPPAAAPTAD